MKTKTTNLSGFTTVSNLMRNGKKEFQDTFYKKVIFNSSEIGMILGKEFSEMLESNGILDQLKEEFWEFQDKETVSVIKKYRKGDKTNSINFDDFRKKYNV